MALPLLLILRGTGTGQCFQDLRWHCCRSCGSNAGASSFWGAVQDQDRWARSANVLCMASVLDVACLSAFVDRQYRPNSQVCRSQSLCLTFVSRP
ncbi:hypothetical protein Micbo1qcDRAFT_44873 [Microdochium bolleyi]|uniref:Secreted protein n=1 Tax=Microdochium bolleyi TaxID=196109 RepID=A0A136JBY0_9PEZI|nr:hypothetical protein Micbo1qcDRAFT_44873 [Microdochium bolleyi]